MNKVSTKTDIKSELCEELKCPADYINRLNRHGTIDELKKQLSEGNADEVQEIMNSIYDEYKSYCEAYGLDSTEDNRSCKL